MNSLVIYRLKNRQPSREESPGSLASAVLAFSDPAVMNVRIQPAGPEENIEIGTRAVLLYRKDGRIIACPQERTRNGWRTVSAG